MRKHFVWILFPVFLSGCILFTPYNDTEAVLRSRMSAAGIPGLSAAVVSQNGTEAAYNLGYRNIEQNLPVTDDTLFCVASISKTLTGAAVMKAWEEGLLDLDQDINNYLPYSVRHPLYPNEPITVKMLLSHSSGIISNWNLIESEGELRQTVDPAESQLKDLGLLEQYLVPGKRYYFKENFSSFRPGSQSSYSNIGISLLAVIIERVTGVSFIDYTNQKIIAPLNMEGAWSHSSVDLNRLARHYDLDGNQMEYTNFFTWPSGSFITSIEGYSRFIEMILNHGEYRGVRILKPETVDLMTSRISSTDIYGDYGLVWQYTKRPINGRETIGHEGRLNGLRTFAYIDPESKTAVLMFVNVDWFLHSYILHDMVTALFLEGEKQ